MTQPQWKTIGTVGDCNPVEYSGGFVWIDETGVYDPECTWIEAGENEDSPVTVYRFVLESCTWTNGILSDNKFHPLHPVWFQKDLESLASNFGESVEWLVGKFCSDNPMERAFAWIEVAQHWGFDNLDSYPLTMTPEECEKWIEETNA